MAQRILVVEDEPNIVEGFDLRVANSFSARERVERAGALLGLPSD